MHGYSNTTYDLCDCASVGSSRLEGTRCYSATRNMDDAALAARVAVLMHTTVRNYLLVHVIVRELLDAEIHGMNTMTAAYWSRTCRVPDSLKNITAL